MQRTRPTESWTIPDEFALKEYSKVVQNNDNNGIYFPKSDHNNVSVVRKLRIHVFLFAKSHIVACYIEFRCPVTKLCVVYSSPAEVSL